MNKCPNCGTEFSGNFCPNCGKKWEEKKVCPVCGTEYTGEFCPNCEEKKQAQKVCPNCGTEFLGNFCPNCGEKWQDEKECPVCHTKLPGDAKFCNHCGYSFFSQETKQETKQKPEQEKKQGSFMVWVHTHKKQVTIGVVTLAILLFLGVVLGVTIGVPLSILHRYDGTYYLYDYVNETYDESDYYRIDGNRIIDRNGDSFEVAFDGDQFRVYTNFFGQKMVGWSGKIGNGALRGSELFDPTYAKKGHKHKYGEWETITQLCDIGEEARECVCGKRETRETNGVGHQFEDGTCLVCGAKNITYSPVEGGYAVVDCDPKISGNIDIPATYDGKPVVSIGKGAFYDCRLSSIVIPDSVTSIGSWAFTGCGLKVVYYCGSAQDWTKIAIEDNGNGDLFSARLFCFTEDAPTAEEWASHEDWWYYDPETSAPAPWTKDPE